MFRRLMVLASTALITGVLAGCGTTDSWVQAHAADGWPAQYGDAANSSYSPVAGANALRLEWRRSVKGDLAAQVALGSGRYLAVNAQSAGGCSLMVWETDNNARQRWCTRLVQGGGLVQSAVRRVRQSLHRPARRDAVLPADAVDPVASAGDRNAHHPKDSRAGPAAGRHASRAGAGVRRPQGHRRRHAAGSGRRRQSDRLHSGTGRLPTDAATLPSGRGAGVFVGHRHRGGQPVGTERRGPGPGWASLPCRPDPAAHPRVDQRRGGPGPDRQPGAFRRRVHRVRQRPRRSPVGDQHRERQAEMVSAAGLSGADAAVGVAGRR